MYINIKKLETFEERIEAERLISTSFLHEWNENEAVESASNPNGETWAAYDNELMLSAITVIRKKLKYEGSNISCAELHMVGTLPEARGAGTIKKLMDVILRQYKDNGDLFTILIPFSFAFYRKYGFELASEMMIQEAQIEQFSGFKMEMNASRIASQKDVDKAHKLYDAFTESYNLAEIRDSDYWEYKENGEFGCRDWEYSDKTHYSYLFCDKTGEARAYFTFVFIHGSEGPFWGTMKVTELVFDSPDALRNVFGFFYGMRAKIRDISFEMPRNIDMSIILPECDSIKRSLDGHVTMRALNIKKILYVLRQPEGKGEYSIHITDKFIDENTGTYKVRYENCKTIDVQKNKDDADLDITVETFCQLAAGLIDIDQSIYREGTKLNKNKGLLQKVFYKKPIILQ